MPGLLSFGLNILADIFYPKYCFSCQRSGGYLCKFCINQIPSLGKNFCVVCNSPSTNGFTHQPCRTSKTPDRFLSAFAYQNKTVADMIITGKYYFVPEVFAVLGAVATQQVFSSYQNELDDFVVCAIPLHTRRQKWRGFNQSAVAAQVIAQGLNLTYYPLLYRTKNTQTQKNLNAETRHINLVNAFKSLSIQHLPTKVILVDDVSTTGQTFLQASACLKLAGVKEVWCLSIAKD